jgi:Fic family protein
MNEFWSGVVTGLATSGIVAAIVYSIQKRDSDRGVSRLSTEIGATTEVAREALRTTIEIQSVTTELHRSVRAAQLAAAAEPSRETFRPEHIDLADKFLQRMDISAFTRLHAALLGEKAVYAGVLRDVSVSVSSGPNPALVPLAPERIPVATGAWLASVEAGLRQGQMSIEEKIHIIAALHTELMRIHPFFDGNGLLGRALVAALSRRLLGRPCLVPRDDPAYFASVRTALSGDPSALVGYLEARLEA